TRNKKLEKSSTCEGLVFCGVLDESFLVNTQHVVSSRAKFHHTSLGKISQKVGWVFISSPHAAKKML
ncbi:MAG: hypothetical protein ACK559_27190, partial [bacterium]